MSIFPGSTPSFAGFTSSHTLAADNHAAQHNSEQAEIIALANKIGRGASTPASSLVLRGTDIGTSAWAQVTLTTDVTGVLPIANGGTGGSSTSSAAANLATEVGKLLFPIGCIYTDTTGTNPGTSLGFGTWTSFGAGQVLVGNGTSDQAFAAGATGGESTHTLTGAESGTSAHGHGVTDPTHTHQEQIASAGGGGLAGITGTASLQGNTGSTQITVAASTGLTVNNSTTANASSSHNNLQPYVVVYFWKRTA